MITAESWHKYQEDYVKYGVDLRPAETEEKKVKSTAKPAVTANPGEKLMILFVMAAVGVCCIVMIFLQAYTSDINYNIYTLNQNIAAMENDIDDLNVILQSQNNLSLIEGYATETLGMIYPESDQIVSISGLVGSEEVDTYIASLSQSQKGVAVSKKVTVAVAARQLLSQA